MANSAVQLAGSAGEEILLVQISVPSTWWSLGQCSVCLLMEQGISQHVSDTLLWNLVSLEVGLSQLRGGTLLEEERRCAGHIGAPQWGQGTCRWRPPALSSM